MDVEHREDHAWLNNASMCKAGRLK